MTPPTRALGQVEFVALVAMLMATVAFSIDAMLPALPEIGAAISPDAPNRVQLIVTSFILGLGLGTFVSGPLSDTFGRRPVMVGGAALYIAGCVAAYLAQSLEVMLVARLVQGLGASGPRVAAMALVRDLYSGRQMARIMSFVLLVFSLVPALAPTLGHFIVLGFGWRSVFVAFTLFAGAAIMWLLLRQPETLQPQNRRSLRPGPILSAVQEIFANHTARTSILIQTLTYGMLYTVLSSTQQVFDISFGRGATFHYWFGGIAVIASTASLLNARIVVKLGMRPIIKVVFAGQIVITAVMILLTLTSGGTPLGFGAYVFWITAIFFQTGLTIGNLNALAMEPMGHIAGVAASVIASISTVGAVCIAVPIALAFDGTPMPMALGTLVAALAALALTMRLRRPSDEVI